MVKFSLNLVDVNNILAVLGEMPSKTGVWPTILSVKNQAEEQIQANSEITEFCIEIAKNDYEVLSETLGNMPLKSNAWPLYQKLTSQANKSNEE